MRCAPPANKPTPAEIRQCNGHLARELAAMSHLQVIVVLGAIAHQALQRLLADAVQADIGRAMRLRRGATA